MRGYTRPILRVRYRTVERVAGRAYDTPQIIVARQASLQSGRVIDERYTLESPARGPGVGESWKALAVDGQRVRVKFLQPPDAVSAEAFAEQLQTLIRVAHPNVVAVRGGGVWSGRPYVVVDEGPDATLEDWLDELRTNRKQPELAAARGAIESILAGVSAVHAVPVAPVPHQALAPATVIVDRDDREIRSVAVSDAGLVGYDEIRRERLDVLPGFTEYLAPEQLKGELGTPASDVFALGVLAVEIFTTRGTAAKPWSRLAREGNVRGRLGAQRADVPAAVWDVIARALHATPSERYPNALRMTEAWKKAWGDASDDRQSAPDVIVPAADESRAPPPVVPGPSLASTGRRSSPLLQPEGSPVERPASAVFDALVSGRPSTPSGAPREPSPSRFSVPGPAPGSLVRPAAPTVMSMQGPVPASAPPSTPKLSARAAAPTVMSMQSPVLAPAPPAMPTVTPRAAAPTVMSMQSPVLAPAPPATPKVSARAAAPTVMSMESPVFTPSPPGPSPRAAAPTVTSMSSPVLAQAATTPAFDADTRTGEAVSPLDDDGPPTEALDVVGLDDDRPTQSIDLSSVDTLGRGVATPPVAAVDAFQEDSPTSAVMPTYDPLPVAHAPRPPAPDPYTTAPTHGDPYAKASPFTNTMSMAPAPPRPAAPVDAEPGFNSRPIVIIAVAGLLSVIVGVVLARWFSRPPPSVPPSASGAVTSSSATAPGPTSPSFAANAPESVAVGAHACPVGMVHIDPGGFVPARNADDARATGAVPVRVAIGEMCVDRTEVTELELVTCQRTGACGAASTAAQSGAFAPDVLRALGTFCSGVDPSRMQRPANCIDQLGAARFCAQRRGRLPTEDEWEYIASAGSPEARFPWGAEEPDPTRVNGCGLECRALPAVLGVTRALYPLADAWIGPADVGVLGAGASPFHVLDMAGNVWEWTDGAIGTPPPTPEEALHAVRGGGWLDTESDALRVSSRRVFRADTRLPQIGFRCVMSFDRR